MCAERRRNCEMFKGKLLTLGAQLNAPPRPVRSPTLLSPKNKSGAARVGRTVQCGAFFLDDDGRGGVGPIRAEADVMAQDGELIGGRAADAIFDRDAAGSELVKSKGLVEMIGLEARRFDGFLRGHVEFDDVEDDLEQRLVLVVAAGG